MNNAIIHKAIVSCLLAGAVGVATESAHATSCLGEDTYLIPESTSQVPSNTLIWTNNHCENPVLTKRGGAVVPLAIKEMGRLQALQPEVELEIGSTYDLTNCDLFEGAEHSFTVTSGPDTTPPDMPVFRPGESNTGSPFSPCGGLELVALDVVQQDDLLVLDIASKSTLDPTTFTGVPVDFFFPHTYVIVGYLGQVRYNWSFDASGDAVDTRLGAFDLAGNFSGMSAPQTIQLGCGCSMVQSSNSTDALFITAFVGLVVSGVRRRRVGPRR